MRGKLCLAMAVLLLSSCGTFRKVFKSKESHSVSKSQTSDTNTTSQRVDKSITIITERIDTVIITPAKVVNQDVVFNMDSLVNGLTAIKNDLIDVTIHLNPITGILSTAAKIKPRPFTVSLDKSMIIQNDINEQLQHLESVQSSIETKDSVSIVKKEPVKMTSWVIIAFIALVIVAIIYWKKFK